MTTTRRGSAGTLLGGRYRLLEPVPGAGRSWRAHDEIDDRALLARPIELPAGLPGTDRQQARQQARQRALREAAVVARVQHPGVAPVVDAVVEDGAPWVISVLPPGRTLGEIVADDGPVSPAAAALIGLQVLDALAAAGVPHGELTPYDLVIAENGQVQVTGFATTPLGAVGTRGFGAPEGGPGPAADLWALGVTLHVAVEGRMPGGPRPRAGALGPALDALLARDPADRTDPEAIRPLLVEAAGEPLDPPAPPAPAPVEVIHDPEVLAALAAFDAALARRPAPAPQSDGATPVRTPQTAADKPTAAPGPTPQVAAAPAPAAAGPASRPDPTPQAAADAPAEPATPTAAADTATRPDPARPAAADAPAKPPAPAAALPPAADTATQPDPPPQAADAPAKPPTPTAAPDGDADTESARPAETVVATDATADQAPVAATTPQPGTAAVDGTDKDAAPASAPPTEKASKGATSAPGLRPPAKPQQDPPANRPAAPEPDEPRSGPGRKRLIGAGIAAAVLAAVLVPVLVTRGDDKPAAAPAATTAAPQPTGTTASPDTPIPPPAGWQLYRDPAGWSIAVPDDWTATHRGTAVTFTNADRTLRVVERDNPPKDTFVAAENLQPVIQAATPGFDFLRLANVTYRTWPTTDLEFRAGTTTLTHSLIRSTVPGPRQVFDFTWTCLDRTWVADRPTFDTAMQTFDPGA